MKADALKFLKVARGQIQAAINMAEDDRYCIDISHQILASISLLKKSNESLLKEHMNNCVAEAFAENAGEEKIEEVIKLMHKMLD